MERKEEKETKMQHFLTFIAIFFSFHQPKIQAIIQDKNYLIYIFFLNPF